MNTKKPDGKPLELELVEIETPADDPSRRTGATTQTKSLGITNADPFLEEAAREYQNGKIDAALWARATAKAGDDESLAVAAYLRTRASALELERRNARAAAKAEGGPPGIKTRREGPPTTTRSGAEGPATGTRGPRTQGPSTRTRDGRSGSHAAGGAPRTGRPGVPRNVMYLGAAAAGLSFVAVMLWVLAAPHQTETAKQAVQAAVKRDVQPRPAAMPVPDAPAPNAGIDPSLADKVAQMRRAGNWNVLVLNAAEWTRKEPSNGAAWRELSVGYTNLRQFDDALEAAQRAVSLAPSDGAAWSGLGRVHVALERWPDASAAFDKALAVRADDQDALCGAAVIARREGRAKDAEALVQRISNEASCRGFQSESVAVGSHTAKR